MQSDSVKLDGFSEHIRYSRKMRMAFGECIHRLEKQRYEGWLEYTMRETMTGINESYWQGNERT